MQFDGIRDGISIVAAAAAAAATARAQRPVAWPAVAAPGHIGVYPPLQPARALAGANRADFPFDEPGLALTHLARGAVWLALRALGLGHGKRLAMPAYHCGSEVEAARLAGLEIDFYRVDARLQVDEEDLARAAAGADATYLISHFGFPMAAPPAGGPVVEDVAHGLFSAAPDGPLGSRGDAAVFCPRKSLGVPDGGAVLVREGRAPAPHGRPGGRAMLRSTISLAAARAALSRLTPVRAGAAALIGRASRSDAAAREGTLTEAVIGEWDLEVRDMEAAAAAPSRLTAHLVARHDAAAIRERRRRNYAVLSDALGDHTLEPFRALPDGTTPLYFPLLAPDRDAAIARLLGHGVRPLEIWPVPHPLLDRRRFAELEPLRRGLLALPCHQALGEGHMAAVAAAAQAALSR